MTHVACPRPSPAVPNAAALATAVSASRHATMREAALRIAHLFATWLHRARSRAQLQAMDERMLRDIGLDRVAANQEAHKPFWKV
jgi:uncharacterized protein YjiS (DUF1127 family)